MTSVSRLPAPSLANDLANDFESIVLDSVPGLSDSASTDSTTSSRNSSSSSSVASPFLEDDHSVFVASDDSLDLSHKLNGYAIQSIKTRPQSATNATPAAGPTIRPIPVNRRSTGSTGLSVNTNLPRSMGTASDFSLPSRSGIKSHTKVRSGSGPMSAGVLPDRRPSAGAESRFNGVPPQLRRAISTSRLPRDPSMPARPGLNPRHNSADPQLPGLKRRASSARLTRRQIEQLFDSEDTEDLILDDSCIFNVPLSPALYAKSRTTASTNAAAASATTNFAPKRSSKSRKTAVAPPKSDLSAINESEPTRFFNSPGLETLGTDAQDLTQAFHDLPEASRALDKCNRSPSSTRTVSSGRNSTSSTSSASSVSPRGSVSRQPGLPPKSPDEEKRHMREFQKLLQHTAEADRKQKERRKSENLLREKQKNTDEQQWKAEVLPNFSNAIADPKTRELWWRGIPSTVRERVWKQRIGNKLLLTMDDYSTAVKSGKQRIAVSGLDVEAIANDTMPSLNIFVSGSGPLHPDLVAVITAYIGRKGSHGYSDGVGELAAMFLLNLAGPYEAFVALCNILDGSLTQAIYSNDDRTVGNYYMSFLKVLKTKLPTLHAHFQTLRVSPAVYLEPMLRAWFARHVSPDIASRLWDVLIFEGDGFLLRAALGILTVLEHRLYGTVDEICEELATTVPKMLELGDEDTFMKTVRAVLKA